MGCNISKEPLRVATPKALTTKGSDVQNLKSQASNGDSKTTGTGKGWFNQNSIVRFINPF